MKKILSFIFFLCFLQNIFSQQLSNNSMNMEIFQSQASTLFQGFLNYYSSKERKFNFSDMNISLVVTAIDLTKGYVTLFPIDSKHSNVTFTNQSIVFFANRIKILITADLLVGSFLSKMKANMTCEILIDNIISGFGLISVKNALKILSTRIFVHMPMENINLTFYSKDSKTLNTLNNLILPFKVLLASEINNVAQEVINKMLLLVNDMLEYEIFIDHPFNLFNNTYNLNISIPNSPVITSDRVQIGMMAFVHIPGKLPPNNTNLIPQHLNACENSIQLFMSDYFFNTFLWALSTSPTLKFRFPYMIFAIPLNVSCTKLFNGSAKFTKSGLFGNLSISCSFFGGIGQYSLPIEFNSTMNSTISENIVNDSVQLRIESIGFNNVNVKQSPSTYNVSSAWMQKVLEFGFENFMDLFNSNLTENFLNLPFSDILDYNSLNQNTSAGYYQMCGHISFKKSLSVEEILVYE